MYMSFFSKKKEKKTKTTLGVSPVFPFFEENWPHPTKLALPKYLVSSYHLVRYTTLSIDTTVTYTWLLVYISVLAYGTF